MKWSEILEHCASQHLDDRTQMLEGAADEQFTDVVLLRYLAAGQRELARKLWCIHDDAENVTNRTRFDIVDGQATYTLHECVLGVKRVRLSDSDLYLQRVGAPDARPGGPLYDIEQIQFADQYVGTPGRPVRWETQNNGRVLKVDPAPDTDVTGAATIKLQIVRLPVTEVTVDVLDSEPEVPEEYHLALAEFAAGKALTTSSSVDAAGKSTGRALLESWNKFLRDGKRDELRRTVPVPAFRFGGWGNGG